ncbi:hypothetical protein [Geodermatophilus sabuli]|uniref:Uncharacterized protein n=1 Tax=Geodermatophilus sabuli TaxID=1564158 RepID=A0A285EAE0_9ACTN|nr:hypothetical protein [Geodermatophilus sabuli]MBB3085573.1 hypothetical protein [Geodermatophilus sabuli]SNX96005.1 hypothetical protein SAMN06893097_103174 [Geodermatophilus sabuli]
MNDPHAADCGSTEDILDEEQIDSTSSCSCFNSHEQEFSRSWRSGISDVQLIGADKTVSILCHPSR